MSAPESEPIVPAATPAPESPPDRDLDAPRALLEEALVEVKRVIAGQDEMLERVLVCLVAGGHLLIEGIWCWPTRSTAHPRRCSPPSSR
jgi:MoxR-like ATPase